MIPIRIGNNEIPNAERYPHLFLIRISNKGTTKNIPVNSIILYASIKAVPLNANVI
jgi:hypothetical protein